MKDDRTPAAGGRPALLNMAVQPPVPGERRRVLVVDDEPGMRYMARRVLEKRFEVRDAGSGEEALHILENEVFQIAIIDVRLPDASGLDLLSALKGVSPAIDVIVMTGSAVDLDEALEGAIRRKAFFFLRKPFPMSVLETLSERVAETQELEETLVQYARALERNLESAQKFQRRLLPPSSWNGLRIRIASRYTPSERLSGDFLDYWPLPGGAGTGIFVADVMGHGPSSAMITGIVKSQLRSLSAEISDPGDILAGLEEELRRTELSSFLTAFLIFDRPADEELAYAGAGHLPALLLPGPEAAAPRILASDGLPLNTGLPIQPRRTSVITRPPGARILLYTDGYTEAASPVGGQFFNEALNGSTPAREDPATPFGQAALRALRAERPEDGISALEEAWREFVGGAVSEDDRVAMLVHLL